MISFTSAISTSTDKSDTSRDNIIEGPNNPVFPLNGNTYYVGCLGPGCYDTIQEGINVAEDGDTVYVYDDFAPYYENVIVNKSIYLIGEDKK
jgi:hypothetical protein